MQIVCGADGCSAGWVVASKDLDTNEIGCEFCETMRNILLRDPSPGVLAIDIPIGLPDRGPRACDPQARKLLRPYRASSVFPAPIRAVLAATSYQEACDIWYRKEGKKMSRQSWAIVPKIREVDNLLREHPELRDRIREIHPEVCFYFLAGERPMKGSKKSLVGMMDRMALLEPHFGDNVKRALQDRKRLRCEDDDILDAFAALWTAERIAKGTAQSIPIEPPRDRYGLRMEMLA